MTKFRTKLKQGWEYEEIPLKTCFSYKPQHGRGKLYTNRIALRDSWFFCGVSPFIWPFENNSNTMMLTNPSHNVQVCGPNLQDRQVLGQLDKTRWCPTFFGPPMNNQGNMEDHITFVDLEDHPLFCCWCWWFIFLSFPSMYLWDILI